MNYKTILCLIIGAVCARSYAQEVGARERYEIEFGEPTYYDALIERLDFPLAWENAGIADFGQWREAAQAKLMECLLPGPPASAAGFDYKVVGTERRDGYTAQKIEFNVSQWSRVPAYLLVPEGEGPFPALVMLHDHGAQFFIGKEKMVRPFDVGEDVAQQAVKWAEQCYDGRFVGDDYAARGYVVLSVDALFWGERGRKEGIDYDTQQALSANLQQLGMTWTGVITYDDIRSVEFLASLPFVDGGRIGAVGFSMGAHRAWMLAAACDKVAATVAVCWMNTTDALMRPRNNQLKGGSAWSMLVPNLRNFMDYPHVAAIACPRPMLLFNGRFDKLFPVEGTESAFATLRRTWESRNAGEKLVTKIWDTPHIFNSEMQAEVLDFLRNELKVEN